MNSLILFGSCARGDINEHSDVDLLALTLNNKTTKISFDKFIINYYSKSQLEKMTKEGSLFIWHLVTEGKILFDINNEYANIIKNFKLKENYLTERKLATEIGWLLMSKDVKNHRISVNILLYSIRTIVLTHLVLKNIPAFSQKSMLDNFTDPLLVKLLTLKYKNGLTKSDLKIFKEFLIKYGTGEPEWAYQTIHSIISNPDIDEFIIIRCKQLLKMKSIFDFDTYHH
jgi:predicted nucleotidyltransferase